MAQTTKRLRRDPLAAYEWNVSPMAISPATVTPPRALSFGRPVHPFLGACTPQRGTCANAAALGVQWGTCSSIGPRAHMEDFGVVSAGDADVIFGVYDGHGGAFAAEYCQQQLHMAIRSHSAFPWDVPTAIKDGYLQTDREVVEALLRAESGGGACAIIAVVTQSNIIVGNCGDCRAVYSCGDEVHELSQDHTPENESEASRARAGASARHARRAQRRAGPPALTRRTRAYPLGGPPRRSRRAHTPGLRRAARRWGRAARDARAR